MEVMSGVIVFTVLMESRYQRGVSWKGIWWSGSEMHENEFTEGLQLLVMTRSLWT